MREVRQPACPLTTRKGEPMTDREMLELAAKAAGVGSVVWGGKYKLGDDVIDCTDISYVRSGQPPDVSDIHWNPLLDDGDALRLAAKLKIDIEWQATNPFPEPRVEAYQRNDDGPCFCADEHEDDYRRAIVRAAAEIGRQVK